MKLATIPQAHPRWLVAGLLTALLAIVQGGLGAIGLQRSSGMPLYGHDGRRDRLLVVDRQAGRLTLYDAASGRPLRDLDADHAMPVQRDGRVFVLVADSMRGEPPSP